MSINQTQLYDTLQSLTQRPDIRAEFIYGFLDAYGFAKSTITQVRNGGARNVAKVAGDVALKGQLYFRAIPADENAHEAAEGLKGSDVIKAQKIRFVIVTNFNELVAYDRRPQKLSATPDHFGKVLPHVLSRTQRHRARHDPDRPVQWLQPAQACPADEPQPLDGQP